MGRVYAPSFLQLVCFDEAFPNLSSIFTTPKVSYENGSTKWVTDLHALNNLMLLPAAELFASRG